MLNPYTGLLELEIAGSKRVLHFKWDALAKLRTEFGDDFLTVVAKACSDANVEVLARVLTMGLSPAASVEEIMASSPSVMSARLAVETALNLAYFGKKEAPQIEAANPPNRPGILSRWLSRLLFGRGSDQPSSGS